MTRRRPQLVLLCEDSQHEAFARRFLVAAGWGRDKIIRVEKCAEGCGEQWVRRRYPDEVKHLRRHPELTRALVVIIDADVGTCDARFRALELALSEAGQEERRPEEPIAIFVPRRNIETWISYLDGAEVDEVNAYPKLDRERACRDAVKALKAMCDGQALRAPAPDSLQRACVEYAERLPRD